MKDRIRRICSVFFLVCGVLLFLYPAGMSWYRQAETGRYIKTFRERYERQNISGSSQRKVREKAVTEKDTGKQQELDVLYQQCRKYNRELYRQKQAAFCDPWSYTQPPDIPVLKEKKDEGIGYIQIDAMHIVLPLYVGASAEHMKKGAAILGQTSLPVGGENTNCVIAAHRGYQGAAFFRDIENLQLNDPVTVHTFWGSLCYRVEEIAVIEACDSDRVKIREGKDRITLLTCHPYRSHGRQRYVVFCDRTDTDVKKDCSSKDRGDEISVTERTASQADITREKLTRWILGGVLVVFCMVTYRHNRRR